MNCEKFTRNQSTNILVHCNRSDPNRTYKNQEIDHSKTHLNYNLAPKHKDMTDYEFMKKRCEELKILKRKDVNWLVSWVVTMPEDYAGSKALFFREVYNFMENKYGKDNVVSAYVHLDETSPHMHFCFVPVVFDKKKQEYKVNAKQCINKLELKQIHPQIQEYLETKLQTKVSILNGATAGGNKSVEQLKNEEKVKQKAISELVKNPTTEIKELVLKQIPEEQKELIVEQEIENVKEGLKKDPQFIEICKNKAMYETENIEELEMQIEDLQSKKNYIEESIAELEVQHKKQRKSLTEEFEREKQKYNARIIEMQNTTIEQEKSKPSFWDKLAERVEKSKLIATFSYISIQFDQGIPGAEILKNVKKFRKNYDKYRDNFEILKNDMKLFEKDTYTNISIEKIEESEKLDIKKQQEIEEECDYDYW
jgi:hypothetical protein